MLRVTYWGWAALLFLRMNEQSQIRLVEKRVEENGKKYTNTKPSIEI